MREYALIFSNDIQEPEKMLSILKQVKDYVDGVKIGITSSMLPGIEIFSKAKKVFRNKTTTLLADYKIADIGLHKDQWEGTNEKIIRNLTNAGADYITCHTFPGLSNIEECVQTAHKYRSKVLTLPYMTHKGANLFFGMPLRGNQLIHVLSEIKTYGIKNEKLFQDIANSNTITDVIISLGNHFGIDGYIGPANNPEVLKRYRKFTNNEIWSPGFGRQDKQGRTMKKQIEDWAKIVGPKSAMIVGSAIYKAENPAKTAKEIMKIRDLTVSKL